MTVIPWKTVWAGILAAVLCLAPNLQAGPAMKKRENLRYKRYGEILVVTGGPLAFTGHVYNTIGLNDCPEAAWKKLDPAQIKKEQEARAVILNGPRYFVMDSNALAKPGAVESFQGLEARHLADVSLSLGRVLKGKSKPYTENKVARTTEYVFKAGRPVYELVSPDGTVYVMQSFAQIVDPKLSVADLPKLGGRLKLPKGWTYRERIPSKDLVLRANGVAYVLQDELQNSYQRAN